MQDTLGDEIKAYESVTTEKRFPDGSFVCARIDGRSFSKFTSGMNKPFDFELADLMCHVTYHLIKETNALLGYTQSDEISLFYHHPIEEGSQMFFDGRHFKMTSSLAAMASVKFVQYAMSLWPEKTRNVLPTFDARVFEVPSREMAAKTLFWRCLDAERNAIAMIAQSRFSQKELQNVSLEQQKSMLSEIGVDINAFDNHLLYGTMMRRRPIMVELSPKHLESIPEKHRPSGPVLRKRTEETSHPVRDISNLEGIIFDNEDIALDRRSSLRF